MLPSVNSGIKFTEADTDVIGRYAPTSFLQILTRKTNQRFRCTLFSLHYSFS